MEFGYLTPVFRVGHNFVVSFVFRFQQKLKAWAETLCSICWHGYFFSRAVKVYCSSRNIWKVSSWCLPGQEMPVFILQHNWSALVFEVSHSWCSGHARMPSRQTRQIEPLVGSFKVEKFGCYCFSLHKCLI